MELSPADLAALQPQDRYSSLPTPLVQPAKLSPETFISRGVHSKQRVLYVRQAGLYYYQDGDIYRRLDDDLLLEWTRALWEQLYGDGWSAAQMEKAMKKVQMATKHRIDQLDKRYVKIAPGLFWDTELCTFAESPGAEHACFAALFDSPYEDMTTVKVPPLTAGQLDSLRSTYTHDLATLEAEGTLPEAYPFVTAWACGDHTIYMDMLKCQAFTFMPPYKDGSPILIGEGANGKSTYLDLLHSIWGRHNTTSFTMEQMADKHFQLSLAYSFMNAPDEEKDYKDKDLPQIQQTFKVLSARGKLPAEKMFSQKSSEIAGDFVSLFPMNHLPKWKGTGVKALVRRSLVVPFYADFQAQSNGVGKRFFRETFTPDVICRYLGTLLALATYYISREDMFPSPSMKLQQDRLVADTNNTVTFKKEFELFFDSYQSFTTLWADYQFWCNAQGVSYQPKDVFKWTFDKYINRNRTKVSKQYSYFDHGKRVLPLVYRPQVCTNRLPLLDHYDYPGVGSIERLHNDNHRESIVKRMADQAQEVYGEGWREILTKQSNSLAPPSPTPEQATLDGGLFE